jgi:ABC-type phosphate transport system substrate-binding protein
MANTARRTRARLVAAAAVLTALCFGIVPPAAPAAAASFVPIAGAGSSWAGFAIRAWIASVNQFGITVDYVPAGSTAGRSDFKRGTVNWAASEIPYGVRDGSSFDPPPRRGYAYMPEVAGGTAFMYNLKIGGHQVTNLRLSGAVIAGIFTSKITRWNDRRIAADKGCRSYFPEISR